MHETGKVVIAISVPGGRVARKTRLTKTLPVVSFQRMRTAQNGGPPNLMVPPGSPTFEVNAVRRATESDMGALQDQTAFNIRERAGRRKQKPRIAY